MAARMASSMFDMFLYWGSGSAPCWRAMIALEEKGFGGYPNKLISFDATEYKCEEIMKLNPRGQVPTFKHGDIVVNESFAIVDYLESTFPNQGTKLVPDDPARRAVVLQRKYESNNLFTRGLEDYLYKHMYSPEELPEDKRLIAAQALSNELDVWEKILSDLGKDSFIAGSDFSVADVMFFPTLAFVVRAGLKADRFPLISAYYERLKQRPSIQASWPPHWKDTPPQTKILETL